MKTGRIKVDDKKEFSEQKTQQCLFPVVSGRVALKCVPVDLRRPLFVLDATSPDFKCVWLNKNGHYVCEF